VLVCFAVFCRVLLCFLLDIAMSMIMCVHDYVFKFLKRFIYDETMTNILYDSHVLETKNICHRFIINEVFILNPNP